jgi:predicted DNA-binding protein
LVLTLQEKHRLRALQNRALKRIFGPVMEEITDDSSEQIYDLYFSRNWIRVIKKGK